MKPVLMYVVVSSALVLGACQSAPDTRYLDTESTTNLEIPPDLEQSVSSSKFEIPESFTSGTGEIVAKIPVLAQVKTLRLEGSADFYWLAVDGPVDGLYRLVKSFWASEGFKLVMDEPVIGVMQTEWILTEEGSVDSGASFLENIFSNNDLSASQDQYRTRIAKDLGSSSTQIYIAHHGTRFIHTLETRQTEDEGSNEWGYRPPEPELEVEMLSRLMVYLGLNKADVDNQLASVKLFSPRATLHVDASEDETFILVKAIQAQAWNRILHELDRLNIEVGSSDESSGLSGDGVVYVNTPTDEENGLAEIVLVVSEESHNLTRISVETFEGEIDESAQGAELLALLYENLR